MRDIFLTAILFSMLITLSRIDGSLRRIAFDQDLVLCIRAMEAGVPDSSLPEACPKPKEPK